MARYPVPSHNPAQRTQRPQSFGVLQSNWLIPPHAVQAPTQAIEIEQARLGSRFFLPTAASSGQTIAVGLATETDTALAMTVLIQRRSFPTEAKDISGAEAIQVSLGSRIFRPSGKAIPAGLSLETDTALAMTVLIQRRSFPTQKPRETIEAIQILLGTRLYRPLGRAFNVGLASETDTALAITSLSTRTSSLKPYSAPVAVEAIQVALTSRIFRPLGKAAALNLATETDTALAFTVVSARPSRSTQGRPTVEAIQVALGTRFFRVNNKAVQVGLATEADTALAISGGLVATVVPRVYRAVEQPRLVLTEQRSRTASALVKSTFYKYADPAALETDTALTMTVLKTKAIGIASETDTALAATWAPKIRIVGMATETDSALALAFASSPTQVKIVRGKSQVDSAPGLRSRLGGALFDVGHSTYGPSDWNGISPNTAIRAGGTNRIPITRSVNAAERYVEFEDASIALPALQTPSPWQVATEEDTANPFTVNRSFPVGIAIETNSAFQMTRIKGVWTSTSQATETDIALSITRGTGNRYITVNYAQETDSAFAITRKGPQVIILGQVYERHEALRIGGGEAQSNPDRNRQFGRYSLRNQRR